MSDDMIDLRNATVVEVEVMHDQPGGAKFWVNVDGKCVLRIQRAEMVSVRENGKPKDKRRGIRGAAQIGDQP